MHIDAGIAAGGLVVGFVVGLTGMGGGALMTPMLVLFFNVQPLAAVSSDLVASFVMKPVGAGVHLRRGTVHLGLVRWLVLGSVPTAFCGALLLDQLGSGSDVQDRVKLFLGIALLVAAAGMLLRRRIGQGREPTTGVAVVRPLPTLAIGLVGGLIVGLTSVGSGSLMIVMLLALYPTMTASQLVGTDLVQAIPLVGAAALGHILFGDFHLSVTTSLLLGSIPGVYAGARVSARAPDGLIRPVLVVVLIASALKLLKVADAVVGAFLIVAAVLGVVGYVRRRWRHSSSSDTARASGTSATSSRAGTTST